MLRISVLRLRSTATFTHELYLRVIMESYHKIIVG